MKIIEELLNTLPLEPVPVRRVLIGIHWTAVCSDHCGLSSTLTSENLPYKNLSKVGQFQEMTTQEIASLALSDNHFECSVGMSAINSLIPIAPADLKDINAYTWLYENAPGKDVVIVGHFAFVEKLRSLAQNLWVLEKNPRPGDIPAEESAGYLAKAQIIAITGSSLVNQSFNDVLSMCNPSATIMVLGPSTPLSAVLFNYGVSILSGAYVTDEKKTLLTIEQGGAYSQLQGVKRVTLFKKGVL